MKRFHIYIYILNDIFYKISICIKVIKQIVDPIIVLAANFKVLKNKLNWIVKLRSDVRCN